MNAYGDSVVWLVAPLIDGYGGQRVYDWPNATRTTLSAAVQPLAQREVTAGRQVATTDKTMHCPFVDMHAQHRVEWAGSTWWVNGEPAQHYMGGRPDHLEVHLVQVVEADT